MYLTEPLPTSEGLAYTVHLGWPLLSANLTGSTGTEETGLRDICKGLSRVGYLTETHSERGQYHYVGWGPRLEKKKQAEKHLLVPLPA